jgi:inosose dehydratase
MKRREFVAQGIGALALAAVAPAACAPGEIARQRIRFGYAAITWGGEDRLAIEDISAVGFRGIQLRGSAVRDYGDRPAELRELLDARGLTLVALSSGLVRLDPQHEQEDLEMHTRNARFLRDAGGLYLQLLDERPADRVPTRDDYQRMGRLLTGIGQRAADLGITVGYHNHMGNLGQSPDEVTQVLDAADPSYVRFQLDTAHYEQAGGDPAAAVRQWRDRLLFLHVKDVQSPAPGRDPSSYHFVELGRGRVDLPGVFRALEEVGFEGWAVVELDSVPDPTGTPRASAEIAQRYIATTLGLEIAA